MLATISEMEKYQYLMELTDLAIKGLNDTRDIDTTKLVDYFQKLGTVYQVRLNKYEQVLEKSDYLLMVQKVKEAKAEQDKIDQENSVINKAADIQKQIEKLSENPTVNRDQINQLKAELRTMDGDRNYIEQGVYKGKENYYAEKHAKAIMEDPVKYSMSSAKYEKLRELAAHLIAQSGEYRPESHIEKNGDFYESDADKQRYEELINKKIKELAAQMDLNHDERAKQRLQTQLGDSYGMANPQMLNNLVQMNKANNADMDSQLDRIKKELSSLESLPDSYLENKRILEEIRKQEIRKAVLAEEEEDIVLK